MVAGNPYLKSCSDHRDGTMQIVNVVVPHIAELPMHVLLRQLPVKKLARDDVSDCGGAFPVERASVAVAVAEVAAYAVAAAAAAHRGIQLQRELD